MKLPRFTAQTPPPRTSGITRATDIGALTQTGEGAKFRSIQAVGGALRGLAGMLFRVQQDRQAIDTRLQHDQSASQIEEHITKMNQSLADSVVRTPKERDATHDAVMVKFDEYYQQRLKWMDNPESREALKSTWLLNRPRYVKQLYSTLNKQLDKHHLGLGRTIADSYIQSGMVDKAINHYRFLESHNLLSASQAEQLIREAPEKAEKYLRQQIIALAHEQAKIMPYKEAVSYLNDLKGVTSAERNDLIARRKRQNEIETAVTEPKVYWEALRNVTIDPDGTTEEYLASRVGKGLTTDDYKEFMGIKKSNETVSSSTFWKREAWDYIEKQILDVASMTGILYGSGEQLALAAQAHMAFEKAIQDAVEEKKPLKGRELLKLAHEIMLPFRKQVKPLLPGGKLPETLGPAPEDKTNLLRRSEEGTLIIDSMTKPKSAEEFLIVYKAIPDKEARRRYYEKWANEVYK